MPGPEEDDDETLIADTGMADESTDEGRTLVVSLPQDDQDETLIARFPMRLSPRGPLPDAPTVPRLPSRPTPAAGRPMAVVPGAGVPSSAAPRAAPAAVDLDRRALPFPGGQPPRSPAAEPRAPQPAAQPKGDFFPVSHTLPLASRDLARIAAARAAPPAPAPAAPSRPSAPPPARPTPTPPLETPRPAASAAPVHVGGAPQTPGPAGPVPVTAPLPAPAPPAPRPFASESVMAAPPAGTPLFVIRFLLVCGVLTALGLMALIYLEL